MTAAAAERPPVSLITGFLGSGKTTLLNRLLARPGMSATAVIVNEFGAIALDHLLVTAPRENMVMLASGCICCTVRGDLVDTLRDLARKRDSGGIPPFDRVLIETTGLADPVPILQTLVTDAVAAPSYRLDCVATLVDAVHGAGELDAHPEALKQAALADCLLISKCDLADAPEIAALETRLARLNPGARLHRVAHGEISPQDLFGAGLADAWAGGAMLQRWLGIEACVAAEAHAGRHDERIRAFCLYRDRPVTAAGLMTWLNLLAAMRGANLLRVKGLLNVEGKPVVVQAVQTLIHEPVELARWPNADRRSRLVFITRDVERAAIERTLAALELGAGPRAAPGALDPQAYARFVEVAQAFR